MAALGPRVLGCDFSSSPRRRKPIVVALGQLDAGRVRLIDLLNYESLDAWSEWLTQPGNWVGGFDLPLGLPRELIEHLDWPTDWGACMDHFSALSREVIRNTFKGFCDARPVGQKMAHRSTDRPAGSSPSMKWVNPPVAYMLHAGVPRLRAAGVDIPGLNAGDPDRVALEAYPGLLARELIGSTSYKSDDKTKQTPERWVARSDLLQKLELGQSRLGLRLQLRNADRGKLLSDGQADALDAVLCMVQAAWALQQHQAGAARYGLPQFDPLEGWIVTA
ncbi:MAG: DUF429 domain-containing protein [Alphaproteobacteria bacterium]|nr:DUF429 domain-containing protein [Alphaproteobacteria bacterium]